MHWVGVLLTPMPSLRVRRTQHCGLVTNHIANPNNMPYSYRDRRLIAVALFLVACATDKRLRRTRYYLTRSTLPPTPRANTAWQCLFHSRDDRGWIITMGLGVEVFEKILAAGFEEAWTTQPIPRNDLRKGTQRPLNAKRSLDAAGALGLVLHHLNSTMADYTLQQIFALTPAKYDGPEIRNAEHLLGSFLGVILDYKMPSVLLMAVIYQLHAPGILMFRTPIIMADGTLIHATINAPGSWHDAAVSRDLFSKLLHQTPLDYWIIGDTAFPTSAEIKGRIQTPPKSSFKDYPTDPVELSHFLRFCEQLVSARQAAEWGMRVQAAAA
ncbi:hypothetical protein BZA77DRAFT_297111 [Pyronema omphalodes]|nr:hypothetical protein BZA77DRAFT_297111 [Pyronema omphalodes]